MKKTLLRSFLIRYLVLSLASLVILLSLSVSFFARYERIRENDYLMTRTAMIARLIDSVMQQDTTLPELRRQLRDIRLEEGLRIYLFGDLPSGTTQQRGSRGSMHGNLHDVFTDEAALDETMEGMLAEISLSERIFEDSPVVLRESGLFWASPTVIAVQQTEIGILIVSRQKDLATDNFFSSVSQISGVLLLSFLVIGFVSGLIMAWMYRRLLRPFQEITAVADGILAGDYSRSIADYPENELQVLSDSINRMVIKLSQLETARLDFTAQIAHELRTPLSVIRMTLQAMQDGLIEKEEEGHFFATALQETQRLEKLTQDLIDLALIENDELPLDISETNLSDLIDSVMMELRPLCRSLDQILIVKRDDGMTGQVDEQRIRQVLLTLLTNSSKFAGKNKTIEITAKSGGGLFKVTVEDNGPGISSTVQEKIFGKYQKWGKGAGAGLGLAIAREIIDAHGGTIEVESDGQSYTRFCWSVPL